MSDETWTTLQRIDPVSVSPVEGEQSVLVELRNGLTFGVCAVMVPVQSTLDALQAEVTP